MPNILGNGYPRSREQIKESCFERLNGFIKLNINDLRQLENGTCNYGIIESKRFFDFIWSKFNTYKTSISREEIEKIIQLQQHEELNIPDGFIFLNIKYTLDQIHLLIMQNKLNQIKTTVNGKTRELLAA